MSTMFFIFSSQPFSSQSDYIFLIRMMSSTFTPKIPAIAMKLSMVGMFLPVFHLDTATGVTPILSAICVMVIP